MTEQFYKKLACTPKPKEKRAQTNSKVTTSITTRFSMTDEHMYTRLHFVQVEINHLDKWLPNFFMSRNPESTQIRLWPQDRKHTKAMTKLLHKIANKH